MKKLKKVLGMVVITAITANANAQTSWTYNADNVVLNPATARLMIGGTTTNTTKLHLYQSGGTSTGIVYGLYAQSLINNASSTGTLYGTYLTTSKQHSSSSGAVYGLYSTSNTYGQSGSVYGTYSNAYNYNSANTGTVYGNYVYGYNSNTTNGTVYGLYSTVSGGNANNRFSGYFTGGNVAVMNGNVGIGTTNPQYTMDIATSVSNSVRIGKVGYTGTLSVPYGAVAAQFNIDFTGYRDINIDQVGARIAAIRFNNHLANSALIQKTGLAFYTNPTGINAGTTDLAERMRITPEGNVGIGTTNPGVKLDVIGHIRAQEVRVCLNQGCDFVFEKDYDLMPLDKLREFITENKHLPEIAPAAVMESEGINLSEMNAKLLQKIEELTLYVTDLQKQIDELKK